MWRLGWVGIRLAIKAAWWCLSVLGAIAGITADWEKLTSTLEQNGLLKWVVGFYEIMLWLMTEHWFFILILWLSIIALLYLLVAEPKASSKKEFERRRKPRPSKRRR